MPYSLRLHFMHPQYGTVFQAEVEEDYTVQELLELLQLSGFISPLSKGNYGLALYDRELDLATILGEIDGMQEGDILRVIAPVQEEEPESPEEQLEEGQETEPDFEVLLSLPDFPALAWLLPASTTLDKLEAELRQRGLLSEEMRGHWYWKGTKKWEAEEDLADIKPEAKCLLRYMPTVTGDSQPSTQDLFDALDKHMSELETRLNSKLGLIQEQIPKPYTIPLDIETAMRNPTEIPYRSMRELMEERRRDSALPALPTIGLLWNGWPWLLLLLLLGGLATALALLPS